jgi:DNA mismatch repair protein MutS
MSNAYTEYFLNQDKYNKIHGKLTIFFSQCGMFFEAYETLEEGYDLQILSNIMNITVTKKDKSIPVSIKNPYMLGFPTMSSQKYIKTLIDNGYTIIIQEQVSPAPKPRREITGIFSPATYINEISKPDSNYMLTILLEETLILKTNKKAYVAGLSLIEPSTGYIKIHETYSTINDEKISLDEIVKFINSFDPSEILLITSNITNVNEIICYLELSNRSYVHKTIEDVKKLKGYANFQQLGYQNDLLKKIYKLNISPIENLNLEKFTLARDSFILSLLYLSDHNSNLLISISKPDIYVKENSMHMGNNPISQLDIFIKEDKTFYSVENTYKCLFDIINKTVTPMGRRHLKNMLIEPQINPIKLELSYLIIEHLQKSYSIYDEILCDIKDTERLDRKINIQNIHPIDFSQWISFQESSLKLFKSIKTDNSLLLHFNNYSGYDINDIIKNIDSMLEYITITYDKSQLEKYLINDITGSIFLTGKYTDIDNLQDSINICNNFMSELAIYFDKIVKKKFSSKFNSDDIMVKVDSNEREGYFLILSTKRAEYLEKEILKLQSIDIKIGSKILKIKTASLKFQQKGKGASTKIFCDELKEKSDKINEYIEQIKLIIKDTFVSELKILCEKFGDFIRICTNLVTQFDFLLSGAKSANKFYYNKPNIKNIYNNKSYFKATQLRHPIVERINIETEYIPTDIELGTFNTTRDEHDGKDGKSLPSPHPGQDGQDGILLFGLNAAGKSTLQKAIGISIIMAQIGYFVPATSFDFFPYKSIITRISSKDNMFKGLSTFGLELNELSTILKRNSENTLIIADELCSGTEHISSLVIVMTMLKMLSQAKASFITATHLHDICNFSSLDDLINVKKYHLHVECDNKTNKLIYDRLLKEGSGSSFYGLLVAKHIINDVNFTTYTSEFLNEYNGFNLNSEKKSRYNKKLFIQKCSVCGRIPKDNEIPLETHHINFQRDCDSMGFINGKNYIHKNHKSNLVILCYKCHDKIDNGLIEIDGYVDTNEGKELNLIINEYKKIISLDQLDQVNNDINFKIKKLLKSISNNNI